MLNVDHIKFVICWSISFLDKNVRQRRGRATSASEKSNYGSSSSQKNSYRPLLYVPPADSDIALSNIPSLFFSYIIMLPFYHRVLERFHCTRIYLPVFLVYFGTKFIFNELTL